MHELDECNEISVWDKAEEKSIHELRELDVSADWSEKGSGSISFGIQKMHQFNIFIHRDSENLIREFERYRWAKDRSGNYKRNTFGKRIPVDKDNHGIDAVRYVILYYYWQPAENSHNSDT